MGIPFIIFYNLLFKFNIANIFIPLNNVLEHNLLIIAVHLILLNAFLLDIGFILFIPYNKYQGNKYSYS